MMFAALFALTFSVVVNGNMPVLESVRETAVNCIGVQSCRPRCITFGLDVEQAHAQCNSSEGIFASEDGPWDLANMTEVYCDPNQQAWSSPAPLTILAKELDVLWEFSTQFTLNTSEKFTLCSMSLCPKEECAVPEQMSSTIRLEVFKEQPNSLSNETGLLLNTSFVLDQSFKGDALFQGQDNRFGPIHTTWMDDPVNCRQDVFPQAAPVAPIVEFGWTSAVLNFKVLVAEDLYCSGLEYEPAPLPNVAEEQPTVDGDLAHVATDDVKSITKWFRLYFHGVSRQLDLHELISFESLTREWIRVNTINSTGILLDRLILLDQSLVFPGNLSKEAKIEQIEMFNLTHVILNTKSVTGTALALDIEIEAIETERLPELMRHGWNAYRTFLRSRGLSVLGGSNEASMLRRRRKVSMWALVAGFETIAIVCIVLVRLARSRSAKKKAAKRSKTAARLPGKGGAGETTGIVVV